MDIDIDIAPKTDIQKLFPNAIRASMVEKIDNKVNLKEHPVGVYFQFIPKDIITGLAAIPFKKAEDYGYLKIDMLNLNILKHFNSKEEMRRLQKKEPNWNLLKKRKVVEKLFHLKKHYDVVQKVRPKSIQDIADIMALIRPNKKVLLDKYIENPDRYRTELFTKRVTEDMRKSHATSYALIVVLQLHLIEQGRI